METSKSSNEKNKVPELNTPEVVGIKERRSSLLRSLRKSLDNMQNDTKSVVSEEKDDKDFYDMMKDAVDSYEENDSIVVSTDVWNRLHAENEELKKSVTEARKSLVTWNDKMSSINEEQIKHQKLIDQLRTLNDDTKHLDYPENNNDNLSSESSDKEVDTKDGDVKQQITDDNLSDYVYNEQDSIFNSSMQSLISENGDKQSVASNESFDFCSDNESHKSGSKADDSNDTQSADEKSLASEKTYDLSKEKNKSQVVESFKRTNDDHYSQMESIIRNRNIKLQQRFLKNDKIHVEGKKSFQNLNTERQQKEDEFSDTQSIEVINDGEDNKKSVALKNRNSEDRHVKEVTGAFAGRRTLAKESDANDDQSCTSGTAKSETGKKDGVLDNFFQYILDNLDKQTKQLQSLSFKNSSSESKICDSSVSKPIEAIKKEANDSTAPLKAIHTSIESLTEELRKQNAYYMSLLDKKSKPNKYFIDEYSSESENCNSIVDEPIAESEEKPKVSTPTKDSLEFHASPSTPDELSTLCDTFSKLRCNSGKKCLDDMSIIMENLEHVLKANLCRGLTVDAFKEIFAEYRKKYTVNNDKVTQEQTMLRDLATAYKSMYFECRFLREQVAVERKRREEIESKQSGMNFSFTKCLAEKYEMEIKELEKNNEALKEEKIKMLENFERTLKEKDDERLDIVSKHETIMRELEDEYIEELRVLKDENKNLARKLEQTERKIADSSESFQKKYDELKIRLIQTIDELKLKQSECNLDDFVPNHDTIKREYRKLMSDFLMKTNESDCTLLQQAKRRIAFLASNYQNLLKNYGKLEAEKKIIEETSVYKLKDIEDVKAQLKTLREKYEDLKKVQASSSRQYENKIVELENDNAELVRSYNLMKEKYESILADSSELNVKIKNLIKVKDDLGKKSEELQKEIDELKSHEIQSQVHENDLQRMMDNERDYLVQIEMLTQQLQVYQEGQ